MGTPSRSFRNSAFEWRDARARSAAQPPAFFYIAVMQGHSMEVSDNGEEMKPATVAQCSRIVLSGMKPLVLPDPRGGLMPVRVSFVGRDLEPCFMILEENLQTVGHIQSRIKSVMDRGQVRRPDATCKGSVVLAKYCQDGQYYRAVVVKDTHPTMRVVHFADYGNWAALTVGDMLAVDDPFLLQTPPQAILVQLDRSSENIDIRSLMNKRLLMQIVSVTPDNEKFVVRLQFPEDVGQLMAVGEPIRSQNATPESKKVTALGDANDGKTNVVVRAVSDGGGDGAGNDPLVSEKVDVDGDAASREPASGATDEGCSLPFTVRFSQINGEEFGWTFAATRCDLLPGLKRSLSAVSPDSFVVRLERDFRDASRMSRALQRCAVPAKTEFVPQTKCIFQKDGQFFRCSVLASRCHHNYMCAVELTDYGDRAKVSKADLLAFDDSIEHGFGDIRPLVHHCRLADVMPPNNKEAFNEEACKAFAELTKGRLQICSRFKSIRDVYEVTVLMADGRSVSDVLCERGLAVPFLPVNERNIPTYNCGNFCRCDGNEDVGQFFTVHHGKAEDTDPSYLSWFKLSECLVRPKTKFMVSPRAGDFVIADYSEDFYRAEVIEVNDMGRFLVRFIDYGNEGWTDTVFPVDRDHQNSQYFCVPRVGLRCQLEGVVGTGVAGGWSKEAVALLNRVIPPSYPFYGCLGDPDSDGVYPAKITLGKDFCEFDSCGAELKSDLTGMGDLADLMVRWGLARRSQGLFDPSTPDLLRLDERTVTMRITAVRGQVIYARPSSLNKTAQKMQLELSRVQVSPAKPDATFGVVDINGAYYRAKVVVDDEEVNSKHPFVPETEQAKSSKRKLLLVDVGRLVTEGKQGAQSLQVVTPLYNGDFFVRTSQRLAIPLCLQTAELRDGAASTILDITGDADVKCVVHSRRKDGVYVVSDISLCDEAGTSLSKLLLEANLARPIPTLGLMVPSGAASGEQLSKENNAPEDLCVKTKTKSYGIWNDASGEKTDSDTEYGVMTSDSERDLGLEVQFIPRTKRQTKQDASSEDVDDGVLSVLSLEDDDEHKDPKPCGEACGPLLTTESNPEAAVVCSKQTPVSTVSDKISDVEDVDKISDVENVDRISDAEEDVNVAVDSAAVNLAKKNGGLPAPLDENFSAAVPAAEIVDDDATEEKQNLLEKNEDEGCNEAKPVEANSDGLAEVISKEAEGLAQGDGEKAQAEVDSTTYGFVSLTISDVGEHGDMKNEVHDDEARGGPSGDGIQIGDLIDETTVDGAENR